MMSREDRLIAQLEIAQQLLLSFLDGHQISRDVLEMRIKAIEKVLNSAYDAEWLKQVRR